MISSLKQLVNLSCDKVGHGQSLSILELYFQDFKLVIECSWLFKDGDKLINSTTINNSDDLSSLKGAKIVNIDSLDDNSPDMNILFDSNSALEITHNDSKYEAWQLYKNNKLIIVAGPGNIVNIMSEKSRSTIWHIAVTHAFITGLIFPLIASYIFKYTINVFHMSYLVMYSMAVLINIIAIWTGVMWSVRSIKIRLTSEEVKRFVKLSSVSFVFIQVVGYFSYASLSTDPINFLMLSIVQLIILTIVFLYFTKKYIKVSSLEPGQKFF